jgi:hypothetical protein
MPKAMYLLKCESHKIYDFTRVFGQKSIIEGGLTAQSLDKIYKTIKDKLLQDATLVVISKLKFQSLELYGRPNQSPCSTVDSQKDAMFDDEDEDDENAAVISDYVLDSDIARLKVEAAKGNKAARNSLKLAMTQRASELEQQPLDSRPAEELLAFTMKHRRTQRRKHSKRKDSDSRDFNRDELDRMRLAEKAAQKAKKIHNTVATILECKCNEDL